MTAAPPRLFALDALRILSATAVVVFHNAYLFPSETGQNLTEIAPSVGKYGYLGVEMFFMISGYVIVMSAEGRTRWQFARARFLRLWPTFVFCLAILLAGDAIAGRRETFLDIAANLTMAPIVFGRRAISVSFWSLTFELLFYAAVALALIGPRLRSRLPAFCASWMALACFSKFVPLGKLGTALCLPYAPFFIVGILIFYLRSSGARLAWASLPLAVLVSAWFACRAAATLRFHDGHPSAAIVASIVVVCAALIVTATSPWARRIPAPKLWYVLGGISYPLYLLDAGLADTFPRWPILITAAVFPVSYAVWKLEPRLRVLMSETAPTAVRQMLQFATRS